MNLSLKIEDILKETANYIVDAVCQKLAVSGTNNTAQPQKLYNNAEARKYLGVCQATLQKYRDWGLMEFSQTGRKIYYTQENLDTFLAKNKKEAFSNN